MMLYCSTFVRSTHFCLSHFTVSSWPCCFVDYDHRQECGVRDERKRELEFLEKVWSLTLFPLF